MKLVAPIKLVPTYEQHDSLLQTLRAANAACNEISDIAWKNKSFNKYQIQKSSYYSIRNSTNLSSQMIIRCIAKVAACYKADKQHKSAFKPHSAQPFDARIFRFIDDSAISIWTVNGRQKIPFVCGNYQRALLAHRKGEVDLQIQGRDFYLSVTCEFSELPQIDAIDTIGVDLGIVNIAFDSDGECFSGEHVEKIRRIFSHRRRNLQRKKTKAAKRKLRKIAGRQARYQKDINHQISKRIVQKAERTDRAIVLEDLSGIRDRVTAKRQQRARLSNWGFYQLRNFIEYKAKLHGIPVILIDPRHTSQTCPRCGHVARTNRRNRDRFCCRCCGHAGAADYIAAQNICARADVMRLSGPLRGPKVSDGNHSLVQV